MAKYLTPKQINTLLRQCQRRLRISDWDITLKVASKGQMQNDGRVAQCQWSTRNMTATITVLDPKDNDFEAPTVKNMQSSLYHELLHPIITPLVGKDVDEDLHEQTIERIAKALAGI